MRRFIILLFCIVTFDSFILRCQTITYDYDNSGNRIKRYIVLQGKGSNDTNEFPTKESLTNDEEEKLIDPLGEAIITIYPNPTHGSLTVDVTGLESDGTIGYQLYSQTGVLLKYTKSVGSPFSIDLNPYPTGMYILILINKDSRSEWKVFKK